MGKRIFNFFIVMSSALILVILVFFTSGTDELVELVLKMRYRWIAVAVCCTLMYWITDAFVIQTITQALFKKQRFRDSFKVTMTGQFFNAITPFASGGQPAQVYLMARGGIKAGHAASIMVVKSILYEVTVFIYSFIAFIFSLSYFKTRIPHFVLLYFIGTSINLIVVLMYGLFLFKEKTANRLLDAIFFLLKKIKIFKKLDVFKSKLELGLESFKDGAVELKSRRGMAIRISMLQILQLTFLFSIPFFIYLAVDAKNPQYLKMLSAQSLSTLMVSYVPTPGSTGGAEGMGYLFFSIFFNRKIIIPVILMWRLITYYSNIVFGGLVALFSSEKPLDNVS
jgi:uncharacterized protein (TIRG00374 family)